MTPDPADPVRAVLARWARAGVPLRPPPPSDALARLFAPFDDRLSADVRRLYALTGGMEDGASDEEIWSLWTPERVAEEADAEPGLLFFADFLLDSHLHAFRYENPERSAVYVWHGPDHTVRVADSVDAFFALYLRDPLTAIGISGSLGG